MTLRTGIATIWIGAALAASATAAVNNTQGTTAQALSFARALELAKQANIQYRIAEEQENEAQARWWQAVLRFGPTGSLQFGHILDDKPTITTFSMPGAGTTEFAVTPSYYSGQLLISQPLFAGLKLINGLNLAGLQADSAKASLELAWNRLYQDVSEAYYGVVVADQLAQVTEELVKQNRDHVAVVKARYREGSASNYDLLRSDVQLANLQPGLLRARNALALARKKLAMVIGLNPATDMALTDRLDVVPEITDSLDELQAEAQGNRLELQNLDRTTRMAEISHTLAAASNLPTLALTGTWTYYDYADQGFPPAGENLKHAWQVGIGLSWPFWDNLAAIPKAAEAEAKVRQSELGRHALADGIRLEVEAAYLSLNASRETVLAQQQTIQQAEAGYAIAREQYAAGMMTNIDMLDAQVALNQAKINYLQALYDQWVAGVTLRRAVGRRLK